MCYEHEVFLDLLISFQLLTRSMSFLSKRQTRVCIHTRARGLYDRRTRARRVSAREKWSCMKFNGVSRRCSTTLPVKRVPKAWPQIHLAPVNAHRRTFSLVRSLKTIYHLLLWSPYLVERTSRHHVAQGDPNVARGGTHPLATQFTPWHAFYNGAYRLCNSKVPSNF